MLQINTTPKMLKIPAMIFFMVDLRSLWNGLAEMNEMEDIFFPDGAIDLFLTAAKSAFLPRVPGSLTYFQPKINKNSYKAPCIY